MYLAVIFKHKTLTSKHVTLIAIHLSEPTQYVILWSPFYATIMSLFIFILTTGEEYPRGVPQKMSSFSNFL